MTVSSVLTKDEELRLCKKLDKETLKQDIHYSLDNILKKEHSSNVNPYVNAFLLSLAFQAKTKTFCDDLLSKYQLHMIIMGRSITALGSGMMRHIQ